MKLASWRWIQGAIIAATVSAGSCDPFYDDFGERELRGSSVKQFEAEFGSHWRVPEAATDIWCLERLDIDSRDMWVSMTLPAGSAPEIVEMLESCHNDTQEAVDRTGAVSRRTDNGFWYVSGWPRIDSAKCPDWWRREAQGQNIKLVHAQGVRIDPDRINKDVFGKLWLYDAGSKRLMLWSWHRQWWASAE